MPFKIFLKDLGTGQGWRSARGFANEMNKGDQMSTGYLTTHVLDAARGCPAAGLRIDLVRIEGETRIPLGSFTTNSDGRTDGPVLPKGEMAPGVYELVFHAGDYLDAAGIPGESPRFLDRIPIRFGIADPEAHYHVPLLLSPFSFSTYRGS